MFNIGGSEMVFLAVLALLVFGPEGLPEIMKTVARTVKAFRQAANDFQSEVNSALTLENQKREVEQRRRKRALPKGTIAGEQESAPPSEDTSSDQTNASQSEDPGDAVSSVVDLSSPDSSSPDSSPPDSSAVDPPPALPDPESDPQSKSTEEPDDDGPGVPMTRSPRPTQDEVTGAQGDGAQTDLEKVL